MALLAAIATTLAWGLWLIPSHQAQAKDQRVVVFYVTLANLLASSAVFLIRLSDTPIDLATWLAIFAGGAIWTFSGACAFGATAALGPARAMGIWSPLNILVSLAWGGLLFREFHGISQSQAIYAALGSVGLLIGLVAVIAADGKRSSATMSPAGKAGYLYAIGAGILWGSYFLPIRWTGLSAWDAIFPMALGMFLVALLLAVSSRAPLKLRRRSDYPRLLSSGLMWSAGNVSSLILMEQIGTGRGFSVAQLCLVINALAGIFYLREPAPRTPTARRVLLGCAIASTGGILLGLSK